MKYLVLFVVLAVAIGIWRSRRTEEDAAPKPSKSPPLALPQDMLACAHCGVHIPKAEAVMLGNQAYCCTEHRQSGPA
ncbi:PP0621 family protein [Acidovorax sp.]|uniref:PP0621 family protein n=1 Tax=Acidovorax sp. TaxID=1872122 RepID=UPI00261BD1D1|nr:PP0621 family protein [Acidovorax sp.]